VIEPLQLSFEVGCDAHHAFDVWTRQISSWWPADHTVSGEAGTTVVLERRLGGRIFERTAGGHESDWGEITAWDPPARLAYVWHIGADRTDATDVEIAFHPVSDSLTRVDVVHRGWERLGAQRGQERRDANHSGWDRVIPGYRELCGRPRAR
jgi:uncharacterized protein YndB with AHSA1/START domain